MTFFYSMYGSTIETLSVYVIINGRESRIWSRHGNRLSRDWIKGCVAIIYEGTYQVVQLPFSLFLLRLWENGRVIFILHRRRPKGFLGFPQFKLHKDL